MWIDMHRSFNIDEHLTDEQHWLPVFLFSKPSVSIHVCCSHIKLSRSKLHKTGDLQVGNWHVNCQHFNYYYYFYAPVLSSEDLEITNKETKNYNGCNGLAGSERVLKWDRVPPLQCYGHLLEQAGGLSLVACDVCRPSSDLLDQFDGLMVPVSGRFDDQWVKKCGYWSNGCTCWSYW